MGDEPRGVAASQGPSRRSGGGWRALLLLWLALVAGRATLSTVWMPEAGVGLGDTEAYYTAWSYDLMWGYHDHPGAIAWLIALARQVVGAGGAPRVVAATAQAATLALLMVYWRGLCGERGALLGAAVFMAIPIYGTGGLLAAPDAPLAAAWAGAALAASRASSWRGWAAAGGCVGLAVLSKLFGVALWVAIVSEAWRSTSEVKERVRRVGVVTLGGVAGLVPTLWFEATHGWTGLRYHALERHAGAWLDPLHGAGVVGAHLLVLSPVLGGLLVWALVAGGRSQARRLTLTTLAPLGLMMVMTRESEPHWAALPWMTLLGPMAVSAWERRPGWLSAGVVVGAALQGLLWCHVMTPLGLNVIPKERYVPRYDLSNDLYGWGEVAERSRRALDDGSVDRVVGYHYTVCGQLAAGLGGLESVWCASRRRDAFDALLGGRAGRGEVGERLLYVRDNRYDEQGPARLVCDAWGDEERLVVTRGGRVSHWYGLRRCDGFRGLTPGAP
ncbi:MAG: hypothetical protein CMH57_03880 [Myxococcales bacterium]|nr:hypothetical protein [Myxococcales bacterium]